MWNNVARNLGQQPVKDLAVDFLEKANDVRRGAAKAMQRGIMPQEARLRAGEKRTTLAQTFARHREAAAIAPVVAEVDKAIVHRHAVMERLADVGRKLEEGVKKVRDRLAPTVQRGQGPRIGI